MHVLRLLTYQALQLSPSLINHRRGKLLRGFLPLSRQLFHTHIQERDIVLKPLQRSLHFGDAEVIRSH
jgi:hypothetical protein